MDVHEITRAMHRLSSEIAAINTRIRNHVYRSAWDVETLRTLRGQLADRKLQLERLHADLAVVHDARSARGGDSQSDELMTVEDTRRVANALFTQRPLDDEPGAWESYTRICAALVRLLGNELVTDRRFDAKEFLLHCGFAQEDVESISSRPGDFIRRSEELFRGRGAGDVD